MRTLVRSVTATLLTPTGNGITTEGTTVIILSTSSSQIHSYRKTHSAQPLDLFAVSLPFRFGISMTDVCRARLITSSTNGYDGSMMNGLQSLTQWSEYFNKPHGGKLGLLNAIQVRTKVCIAFEYCLIVPPLQNIGSLAAYPFAPYASDGIGRRHTILLGAIIMIGATAIQTASQSVGMFIGARYVHIIFV